jgi:putative peptidoglycan lipid II flippase
MSRESLIAYSISVPFVMLIKVLSAGFYANQNIKTPVKVGVVAMLVNIVFNVLLILPLAHMGIAFATTIASITNTFILLILLVRKKTYVPSVGWSLFLVKLIVANVLMVVFFCLCSHRLALWVMASAVWRGWHLLFLMVVGSVIYLITLFLLKFNFKGVFSGNL